MVAHEGAAIIRLAGNLERLESLIEGLNKGTLLLLEGLSKHTLELLSFSALKMQVINVDMDGAVEYHVIQFLLLVRHGSL